LPEWEQDWDNLHKEFYVKCNYDGYELTDVDVPKHWFRDYLREGIQIKIHNPFRLRPWYDESTTESTPSKDNTSFLTLYGTEAKKPFGKPTKIPSFWKPIDEWIRDYIGQRTNFIIEWLKPIIEWMKPIIQWMKIIGQSISLICSKITKVFCKKSELRPDTRSTENLQMNDRVPVLIRTRPTPNMKFTLEIVQDPLEPNLIEIEEIEPDVHLEDQDLNEWLTRIKKMKEQYLLNLDILNKLKADVKKLENKMDRDQPGIRHKFKRARVKIKIWFFGFRITIARFITRKLPYFMKDNENTFKNILWDARRRSMPLIPGYFNDRFFIYKIASFLLKLKSKGIDVNLFDESVRRGKIETMEDENEKISSSFIFEYIFIPRRRREFRILNRLNLESTLGESAGLSNSKDIKNDEELIEKDEHLSIDTREKIRRFLWPRYRFEDLICMNRYWWNTNDGSRSVMLR
ncbi:hypothetical protein KI387_039477, partial [Taxus chinensis]